MKFVYVFVFTFVLIFNLYSSDGIDIASQVNANLSDANRLKIAKLRGGASNYLKTIRYEELRDFIIALNEVSKVVKEHPIDIVLRTYNKPNVLKSFVGGLHNPDPRVRITSSLILQDIIKVLSNVRISKDKPELTAEFIRKRHKYIYFKTLLSVHPIVHKIWYLETVNNRLYNTVGIDAKEVSKNTYKEIDVLDLLIVNKISLYKIKEGQIAVKDFGTSNVDKRIFISLAESGKITTIDNYGYILINSLRYKDRVAQQKAAYLLLVTYYNPSTNNQLKNDIREARKEYKVLEETFQSHISKKTSKKS